ncbi:unnamed protein product [Rhizoctonia solani]|uniref:F-box domain-containing protein n=1 Tax=Rhizoctonia solani TaxID=456999 RepID=A0A8H3D7U3_9AGAM|nr:unnamed protein product [Rhizoctonia solani]
MSARCVAEAQPHTSEGQHEEESHEHNLERPSKRTRTNTPKQKAPRKKYVKGKQGGLQGIMNLPIEVFMEMAHHVYPGDLISLIRTNKFFRAMLLNQSAVIVWQRVLSNVPELPPCPTGMMEPQYAALMFSKYCTLCGAVATSKPDPFLQVRLCSSCRETELEEKKPGILDHMGYRIPFTIHIKRTKKSIQKLPAYYLLPHKRELDRVRDEFVKNDDQTGLAEWRLQQGKSYSTRLKEGERLLEYFESVAALRSGELKDLKSERRAQIYERLEALGWEDKYFCFMGSDESAKKQWNSLVEVSKPLTERIWTNMLPKLTQLLEENRPQVDEFHRQERHHDRQTKALDLLLQLKRSTHPYQSIVDALQLERPQTELLGIFMDHEPLLANPFPEKNIVSEWDFFVSLYEEENSLERVGELFHERRDLICQKLQEWQAQVEAQLVEQYKSSFSDGASPLTDADTALTVQGSTDATRHLSKNAQFLLRADTVFMPKVTASSSEVNLEHGPVADHIHFPDIPCIINNPDLFHYEFTDRLYQVEKGRALECYVRHAGKETIVKALLRQLQMPDVAYIELENMGKVFVCGRCGHGKAMEWHKLVRHYHLRRRDWVGDRFVQNTYSTRHPVIFRNVHDLELGVNPKPLVRVVPSEENIPPPPQPYNPVARCVICRAVDFYEDSTFESLAKMKEHMLEVHDTAEPVEDLHFMNESGHTDNILFWVEFGRGNWGRKWDAFHDNQGASSSTSHEAEIPPQSASTS